MCTKKGNLYLKYGLIKSRFPLNAVDGQTGRRTDICNYRVASLLKRGYYEGYTNDSAFRATRI